MSRYSVLYYPDFHPDSRWLRRVLLLADEVSRIVPLEADVEDPDDLVALQATIPNCLRSVPPHGHDVTFEPSDLDRFVKTFAYIRGLKNRKTGGRQELVVHIARGGALSVQGHVFLHDSKMSSAVRDELARHGLLVDGLARRLGHHDYVIVDERASTVILSAIAAQMARRLGLDTITDRPLPFVVNSLGALNIERNIGQGGAEGALLAALASLMIPSATARLPLSDYRELRDSYSGIRQAFQGLTAETIRINRLDRIEDPTKFLKGVEAAADELFAQYQTYRKSRFGKAFRAWAPMSIASLVAAGASALKWGPLGTAGVSFAFKVLEKRIVRRDRASPHDATFQMIAGIRRDIVQRSAVVKLI